MSALQETAQTSVTGSFGWEVFWGAVVVTAATALLVGVQYFLDSRRKQSGTALGKPPGTAGASRIPGGLVTGVDNRRSTSKTIAVAWTLIVAWMVVTLGLIAAETSRTTFSDLLHNASDLYLVFLGGPYAAAAFAKFSTQTKVNQSQLTKLPAQQPSLFDVVSDDNGNTDMYDFQYTLFNLIAIVIVVVIFIGRPGQGLPAIPDFLAVLTGGSALTYTVNKALASSGPQISVSPSTAHIGDVLTVTFTQLTSLATPSNLPTVTVGGMTATNVTPGTANTVTATIAGPPAGQEPPSGPVQVVVTAADGTVAALDNAVTIVDTPEISAVAPLPVQPDTAITVSGKSLLPYGTPDGTAVAGTASVGGATVTLTTKAGTCDIACEGPYSTTSIALNVSSIAGSGEQEGVLALTRGGLTATKTIQLSS
jgi:hypothetical protein